MLLVTSMMHVRSLIAASRPLPFTATRPGDSSLVRRITGPKGYKVRVRVSACSECLTSSLLTSIM